MSEGLKPEPGELERGGAVEVAGGRREGERPKKDWMEGNGGGMMRELAGCSGWRGESEGWKLVLR